MTGRIRADAWPRLAERLEKQFAKAGSRAVVNKLAELLKQTFADLRSDHAPDVRELRREFKADIEEIRAAYRADMDLVVLEMRNDMREMQLQAEREYRALSQQALAAYQPFVARRAAR